ncbi:40S ribosomal protein S21-like [Actinia tenebrosa]|uniref:40S ribosomal protein S21 n=1 Tax=Actinia tenebrosa TaxID=6105 RepID=A0A6P8HPF4_ACTTE|nr:40S ribosomal protein S21-like [Actinia tenebrosa]
MQNEAGDCVDMYIPRKCSVTNRIISAKDHASVQLNVGDIDDSGRFTGSSKTYAFSGFLRKQGEADDALVQIAMRDGIVPKTYKS